MILPLSVEKAIREPQMIIPEVPTNVNIMVGIS
jgi:hypothetical protein